MSRGAGKARHLSRRAAVLKGVPPSVNIPKFMTKEEIKGMRDLKSKNDSLSWEEARDTILGRYDFRDYDG